MSTEPYIGEVKLFAFDFAPKMYQKCNGQILAIATNSALFALLGTTYGGDGSTTFALPNLQSRFPIGQGNGAGLPSHTIGEISGNTTTTLLTSNLPPHTHAMNNVQATVAVNGNLGGENAPDGAFPGTNTSSAAYSSAFTQGQAMNNAAVRITGTTDPTGSNLPINIQNPYLVMNYCIALNGIFPSRN